MSRHSTSTMMTSQAVFSSRKNMTLTANGADAFVSTDNPIIDLFTETRKTLPDTLEEFTILVRKIEAAKNFDSELFIKLLKFHRLIEKGNGLKGLYYICMMILKDEDPIIYEKVLDWSRQYPKDILRLARMSSMFGFSAPSSTGSSIKIPFTQKYSSSQGKSKGTIGKKMTTWGSTEYANGNVIGKSSTSSIHTVLISAEIELYSQLLADIIKKILTGKMFDEDVNLMLFKYLSYETGHFAVESKIIWTRAQQILESDSVIQASLDSFIALQSMHVV